MSLSIASIVMTSDGYNEEQHEGQDDRAHSKATCASAGTEEQTDNRPMVDSDQNMMDPVQVLEEDSAPPGFDHDDASGLKTRVAEKELVPPGFGVTHTHLEEGGSAKKVSSKACVIPIENNATGGVWQVQTTAEGPKNQSRN